MPSRGLGQATLQALSLLNLDEVNAVRLHQLAGRVISDVGPEETSGAVREIRYLLIKSAQGPVDAFLADAAARILGDDIGKMFPMTSSIRLTVSSVPGISLPASPGQRQRSCTHAHARRRRYRGLR